MADVEYMIAGRVNVDNSGNDMGDAAVEQRNISIEARKPVDLQSLNWSSTEVAAVLISPRRDGCTVWLRPDSCILPEWWWCGRPQRCC